MSRFRQFISTFLCEPESPSGVVLGRESGRTVVDTTMSPALVLGASGAGKSVSVLIPTLLTWRGSAVVVEPRGELASLTSAWRRDEAANRVHHWTFSEGPSPDAFNLLDGIRRATAHEPGDIEAIAGQLIQADGRTTQEVKTARALVGLAILAARDRAQASMSDVHSMLIGASTGDLLDTHGQRSDISPALTQWAASTRNAVASVPGAVLDTARALAATALSIFTHPEIRAKTATSTFSLDDLQGGEGKTTLYLACPPHRWEQLRPLQAAFLHLLTRHATQESAGSKWPMLMVLDEFAELGRLHFLAAAMPALGACGVKLLLAVSSLDRLRHLYGSTVWDRCATKVMLPFRTTDLAAAAASLLAVDYPDADHIDIEDLLTSARDSVLLVRPGLPPTWVSALRYYENAGYRAAAAINAKVPTH